MSRRLTIWSFFNKHDLGWELGEIEHEDAAVFIELICRKPAIGVKFRLGSVREIAMLVTAAAYHGQQAFREEPYFAALQGALTELEYRIGPPETGTWPYVRPKEMPDA